MVNRPKNSSFLSKRWSLLSIALCMAAFFAFSITVFTFFSGDMLEDEEKKPLFVPTGEVKSDKMHDDDALWAVGSSHKLHSCVKRSTKYKAAQGSDRYITVKSNGGLNQMRTGIADMVAVAHIMNATLVIPLLDKRSFWQDTSTFADIFDQTHFITSLQNDLRVVNELPKGLQSVPHVRKHFSSWASMGYYEEMRQLWKDYRVIHVAKSDSRLANNDLPLDVQRLRCRVLYQALHFLPAIENLGKKLVERLRSRAERFIALHLRYEKDMLSFTGCTHGLTEEESKELQIMRENTNHWKMKNINSTEQRINGLCPLSPKEVGIFLHALGYPPSTLIYIAAGDIYGGNTHLSELTSRYPNIVFKETLASEEELKAFSNHASQSAALDYIISIESDVFVPSHSGNMARAVEGHRRFLGHRKTITPDRKGLVAVLDQLDSGVLKEGPILSRLVLEMHKNRQGSPRKREGAPSGVKGRARFRLEEPFYQNPYPECICGSKMEKT